MEISFIFRNIFAIIIVIRFISCNLLNIYAIIIPYNEKETKPIISLSYIIGIYQ